MKNEKLYLWVAFATISMTTIVMFFLIGMLKGCGVEPTGKKIVEKEGPIVIAEPPQCEGADGKPTRSLPCADGSPGEIIEACNLDSQWEEVASTCNPPVGEIFASLDYMESVKLAYLTSLANSADRLNTRFIDFQGAKAVGSPVENAYKAFHRALNSVSFNQDVYKCKPLDDFGTACAIDVREISQTKARYDQVAIHADLPFESKTTKGLVIQQLTGTKIPSLHYEEFIATVFAKAQVYYDLMGFKNSTQAFALFGINEGKILNDVEEQAIGTNESAITSARNTRLIHFYEAEFNGRDTACSASFDNPALAGADRDLFQSPFLDSIRSKRVFKFEASEVLCLLPNGLMAMWLHDKQNQLAAFAPETIVHCNNSNCLDATIDISDCMNCHMAGFQPKTDVIRPHVLSSGIFNKDEVELAKAIYLLPDESNALFIRLNEIYRQGMEGIDHGLGEENHFILTFNSYFRLQDREQVAAFLFIKPETLDECINSSAVLRDQLGSLLIGGKITHDTLKQAFQALLDECKLNVAPLVRPE